MTDINPYRQAFVRSLTESMADFLDEGYEVPFGEEIVAAAADRLYVRRAAEVADAEGRWLLAWMLRRFARTIH